MSELVFYRRGEKVIRVSLERQRLVLGRGEACDVIIPAPHMSRQQVALVLDGPVANSTNGTFAAGLRLFEAEIPLNTVLRVGEMELVFEPASQGQ